MPAHPHTGPGAEGGGGWPMHATAQPWHAEGQTLPTGALRSCVQSQAMSRNSRVLSGGCREHGIAREITGGQRNRLFAYDAYQAILSEGAEPL
jgi:hypothetical protein